MKVKDLLREIATQDLEAEVVLASDAEGNAFHSLSAVEADKIILVLWPSDADVNLNSYYGGAK